MKGNQAIINGLILEHDKNPIKEKIDKHSPEYILHVIMHEYWKEWRYLLSNCETPYIIQRGLGVYQLQYGKARKYMYRLIARLRMLRDKYPEEYLDKETYKGRMYTYFEKELRVTWKQVDHLKKEINLRNANWRQKKINKYGDKAIL